VSLAEHIGFPNLTEPALCAETDPELFFPENPGSPARAAKRVCAACLAQPECLQWAVSYPEALDGVWGGTSVRERRVLRLKAGVTRERMEPRHGTEGGATAHYRAGEKPCDACLDASRAARRRRWARSA
jgi:WhiB family redox-sensing transcriptional regulator